MNAGRAPSGLLRQIDPARLGEDTAQRVADHVARLSLLISPRYEAIVREVSPGSYTDISHSVQTLSAYARDGVPLDAPVHEYLVSLVPLYQAPCGDAPVDLDDEADATTELGTVIRAAIARDLLDKGGSLTTAQLATLGSVTPQQVRHLGREGELQIEDGLISASECRRWLGARGLR